MIQVNQYAFRIAASSVARHRIAKRPSSRKSHLATLFSRTIHDSPYLCSFVSSGPEYHQAFKTFLAHTDQKDNAMAWIKREVEALDDRRVLIDAGAGSGKLTVWFTQYFSRVIAIEPNPSLEAELRAACPSADVFAMPITMARPFDALFCLTPATEYELSF